MKNKYIIIFVIATSLIVLASFGIKGVISKRGKILVEKTDVTNKQSMLDLAAHYRASGQFAKARETLSEFAKRFPDFSTAGNIRKEIEELNMKILFSDIITNDSFLYEIKPGDTLARIASRFNTTVELLRKSNNLKTDLILPSNSIKITAAPFRIVVDKSDNTLMLQKPNGEIVKTYSVSTGENLSTPTGTFKIEEKLVSPVWYKVGAAVPPDSPDYELGSRWMGLSVAGYGIHGTNDDFSIGKHITKGCVRMRNQDVEELYAIVPSGTEVTIVE